MMTATNTEFGVEHEVSHFATNPYLLQDHPQKSSLLNNSDFVSQLLQLNGLALEYCNAATKADPFHVKQAVAQNQDAAEFIDQSLKSNIEIAKETISQGNPFAIRYFNDDIMANPHVVLLAAECNQGQDSSFLLLCPITIRSHSELMIKILEIDPHSGQYAHSELSDDSNYMLAAIKSNAAASSFISQKLSKNLLFLEQAIRENPNSIEYFQSNDNFDKLMGVAIAIDGATLRFSTAEQQNDSDTVRIACKSNGKALEFASIAQQNNPETVRIACKSNGEALEFASIAQRNNPETVRIACKSDGLALRFASNEQKDDYDTVMIACTSDGRSLGFANQKKQNDANIVQTACKQYALALEFASEDQQNSSETVRMACTFNGLALEFASKTQQNDPETVRIACESNGGSLEFASRQQQQDHETGIIAIQQDANAIRYIPHNENNTNSWKLLALSILLIDKQIQHQHTDEITNQEHYDKYKESISIFLKKDIDQKQALQLAKQKLPGSIYIQMVIESKNSSLKYYTKYSIDVLKSLIFRSFKKEESKEENLLNRLLAITEIINNISEMMPASQLIHIAVCASSNEFMQSEKKRKYLSITKDSTDKNLNENNVIPNKK